VLELVPESVARELIMLPIGLRGRTLVMAMLDPLDMDALAKVQFILNRDIEPVRAAREQLVEAINRHYGRTELESVTTICFQPPDFDFENDVAKNTSPVARLVDLVLAEAIAQNATEIHILPEADHMRVVYRVKGQLFERDTPPRRLFGPVVARIELLAGMESSVERLQNGRIRGRFGGRSLEVRVVIDHTSGEPRVTLAF
jgi:type IV pilus assembly protein PilB